VGKGTKETLPALLRALNDKEVSVQGQTISALMEVGPEGIPGLTAALQLKEPALLQAAAQYLGNHGAQAKSAVPELIHLLDHADGNVRRTAAAALGAIGPDARTAMFALNDLLDDADATVRGAAQEALKRIKQ
jgi:HEAT repeat protein